MVSFISGKSILTKSKVLAEIANADQANDKKYKIVCLKGSTSEKFVQTFMPDAQMVSVAKYDDGVKMVIDDSVDGMVADYPICLLSVLRYGPEGLVTLDTPLTIEPIGMALPGNGTILATDKSRNELYKNAASAVMKNTKKYSEEVVKMANYAKNFGCKRK